MNNKHWKLPIQKDKKAENQICNYTSIGWLETSYIYRERGGGGGARERRVKYIYIP
jgi:hypothetical protein